MISKFEMKVVYACAVHNREDKHNVLCLHERKWTKTWQKEGKRFFISGVSFSLSVCACVCDQED